MKTPCEECITLSICRNKYFPNLIKECSIVDNFLHMKDHDHIDIRRPSFMLRSIMIFNLMNPSHWRISKEGGQDRLRYRADDEKGTFLVDRHVTKYQHDAIGGVTYYP